jgi:ferric-dicitrate binding protein FerR (iron transport regulator)
MFEEKDILKFLAGDLSKEDQMRLDAERQSNPGLSDDLDLMSKIWQESDHLKSFESFDAGSAWDKMNLEIEGATGESSAIVVDLQGEAKVIKAPASSRMWAYLAAAACMALLVMAGLFMLHKDPFITVGGDTWAEVTTLEDGTVVTLSDQNSVLIYPRTFKDKDERRVVIQGNSLLDVYRDTTKTFFVDNYKAGIEVIGTSFIIESDTSASILENVSGSMSFFDIKNPDFSVVLDSPGQKVIFDGLKFADANPKPDPIPIDTPGMDLKIEFIFDELTGIYPETFLTLPITDADSDGNELVRVDMEQTLDGIIAQLDSTALIEYIKDGRAYRLISLKKKR